VIPLTFFPMRPCKQFFNPDGEGGWHQKKGLRTMGTRASFPDKVMITLKIQTAFSRQTKVETGDKGKTLYL